MFYFSASTTGFYREDVHGPRYIAVPDPSWSRPRITATLQSGESYVVSDDGTVTTNDSGEPLLLTNVPDWSAQVPMVETPNPKIPADVVGPITAEEHDALMTAQAHGMQIKPGPDGWPMAVVAVMTLAEAQADQVSSLSAACAAQIVAGFESIALGSAHSYPAKLLDQQNLTASVLASLMPGLPAGWTTPFWCADAAGVWSYVPHTAEQIQQVGQDGKAAVLAALTKNQQRAQEVAACATVEAVRAVVW